MALYKSVFNTLIYAHTRAILLWPHLGPDRAAPGIKLILKSQVFTPVIGS